ncbi:MAG: HdaA/DnaA family protein [Rubrivivax sp.]|jgi:DnaA family protein
MKQLPLQLSPDPVRSLESFVSTGNELLLAHIGQSPVPKAPLYLWGVPGCGKTHLLRALAGRARAAGRRVRWWQDQPAAGTSVDEELPADLLLVDDVQRLTPTQQHDVFSRLVRAPEVDGVWAAAGDAPVVDLPLREDLRTRLGWGHVFEVCVLDEAGTREVLRREAARRGIVLGDDVLGYLLSRFDRDLSSLMRLLDGLDVYALAEGRAVTVPLLRRMLAQPCDQGPAPWSPT